MIRDPKLRARLHGGYRWKKLRLMLAVSMLTLFATACATATTPATPSTAPAAAKTTVPAVAPAKPYPTKPIEMIIAYPPGGGTDVGGRALVPFLEKELGTSVAVINKDGAGGEIGFTQIALSKPDGYTIGWINGPIVVMHTIARKTKFQITNFEPLMNIVYDPAVLVVSKAAKEAPWTTLEEFVQDAKAKRLRVASTQVGADTHLFWLRLAKLLGTQVTPVFFEGGAEQRNNLLGGHIAVGLLKVSEAKGYFGDNQLRPLAVMSSQRVKDLPNVPTFKEKGIDIIGGAYRALVAPAGLPDNAKKSLVGALEKIVKDPAFVKKNADLGLNLQIEGPDQLKAMLDNDYKALKAIWDEEPWEKTK